MIVNLQKDIEVSSKTVGNYWLSFINLNGKYSYELLTKEVVLKLKNIAEKEGYLGYQELLNWFKHNRPAIFASSISDDDPNRLINELIDILKEFEV
jgi:hypothetical protein